MKRHSLWIRLLWWAGDCADAALDLTIELSAALSMAVDNATCKTCAYEDQEIPSIKCANCGRGVDMENNWAPRKTK